MLKLISYRLLTFIPVLLIVALLSFALLYLTPGSPGQYLLGESGTAEAIARIDDALGVNDPFVTQFSNWIGDAGRGDLGTSLVNNEEVTSAIAKRIGATLSLAVAALILALLVGVSAGVAAALHPGRALDRLSSVGTSLGLAIPGFWLGILLAEFFIYRLGWFPILGYTPLAESPWLWLKSILLPAIALAIPTGAVFARHTRNQLIDVLQRDYIRTARAKGASGRRIVVHHALRNALGPTVTLAGTSFVALLGGTVIIERIFSVPGVGSLVINAAYQKDLPLVQGAVIMAAIAVLLVNLTVDIINGFLDPRLRAS